MNILAALAKLDPENDQHWTADGAPRIDAVTDLVGAPVTRAQIVNAAPKFTRDNREGLTAGGEEPAAEQSGAEVVTEALAKNPEAVKAAVAGAERMRPETRRFLEIDEELKQLHEQKGAIDNRMAELSREQARLQRFAPSGHVYDHKADQAARMEFIRAQNAQRAERVAVARAHAAVVTAARAPIDSAMARKTGFGLARPQYPAVGPRE